MLTYNFPNYKKDHIDYYNILWIAWNNNVYAWFTNNDLHLEICPTMFG